MAECAKCGIVIEKGDAHGICAKCGSMFCEKCYESPTCPKCG